jgi:hypothetical protein
MTRGPALPCPACKRTYEALDWIDANHCRCLKCQEDFDFFPFPALVATKEVVRPQAVAVAEDSTCFFHGENQAEKVCDGCGRFLCAVCAVPFAGKTLCPNCIANSKKDDVRLVASRFLPGSAALSLALLPILLWPFTLLTSPIALYLAITGWKKPQSLVKPGRWKLVVAGIIALMQIGGWVFLGVTLLLET